MIVCRDCGQRNTDADTFCGSCGRFLEWTGDRIAEPEESTALQEARAELEAPKRNRWQRILDATVGGHTGMDGRFIESRQEVPAGKASVPGKAAPPPPPGKAPPPPPPPSKKAPPPPPPSKKAGPPPPPAKKVGPPPPPAKKVGPPPPPAKAEPDSVPPPENSDTPAEALIAPVEPGQKVDAEPEELAPAVAPAVARPVRRAASTRKPKPGELICGECGEGNLPARKFCGRCGEPLTSAEQVRISWWRRLRRRRAKVLKAGSRPGRGETKAPGRGRGRARRVLRKIRTYAFVVVLGFGLLAGFYPPLRTYVTDKFDALRKEVSGVVEQTMDPARPVSVTASLESPEHAAKLAFDQFANTYWAAPFDRNTPPSITADLGGTTALTRVIVTSGAADAFATLHRPSIIVLSYSNEKSDTFVLKDIPEPQEVKLVNGLGAQTVRIQVLDVFVAEGAVDVAVAELEFFAVI